MKTRICAIIVVTVSRIILAPLCLMIAWNTIAWEFNLPQFNFWVPFCIFITREFMKAQVTLSRKK